MLQIFTKTLRQVYHRDYYPNDYSFIASVEFIQADGHELEDIYNTCPFHLSGISQIQYFYGDMARTILLNLPKNKQNG